MEKFTKREEELMNFMWEYGKPVTSYEMVDLCKDRDWKDSYIHIMIRSLEKKGAIECCGAERSGIKYARKFRAAVSKEEYYVQLALSAGVNRALFAKIASGLVPEDDPDEREQLVQKLEDIIKEYKEREDDE